jgi:hypothetical protein
MNKLNQILAVALLAQAGIIAAVSLGGKKPGIQPPSKVFADFSPDKVTRLEVVGETGTESADKSPKSVTLEKSGTKWGVADAEGYPVDEEKVKKFLESVEKLTARGSVVNKRAYHGKLEVADGQFKRKITVTHDAKPIVFFLGSSPTFKKIHIRKDGSDDVMLVEGITAWDVGQSAADWVDRNYFKVPQTDVWAFTVKRPAGELRFEKDAAANDWAMIGMEPGKKLKKTEVESLVRNISSVTLDKPIGKTVKPDFGFDAPQAIVTMVTGTSTISGTPPKTTTTKELRIGKKLEGGGYYLKSSDSEYVVEAPSYGIDPLVTKQAKDLVE